MGLSAKQKRFVLEYLKSWSAVGAAIAAGYSPHTARQQGSRLLSNADIQAEIAACLAEHTMNADEALTILSDQARNEGSKYYWPDGSIDLPSLIADGKGHLIKSAKPSKYGLVVEFYDAQQALALIGKHYKLFTEQTAFEGTFHIEGLDQLLDRIYGGNPKTIELSTPAIPAEGGK